MSRLARRAGLGPATGIDRVERAYLDVLLARDAPLFGLIRTVPGYVALDRVALSDFRSRLDTGDWAPSDWTRHLAPRADPTRLRVEATMRAQAFDRAVRFGVRRIVNRALPSGLLYLNTGHANLTYRTLGSLRRGGQNAVAVLVHDTIPLDHPDTQRPGMSAGFHRRMRAVSFRADAMIASTDAVAADAARHLGRMGRVPPILTVPFGITRSVPTARTVPPERPYWVTVGTIDERKGIPFLLDLWDSLGSDPPPLLLLGRRGWCRPDTHRRLDSLPANGPVQEIGGLADGDVAALVAGAMGCLQPSMAEGFGFPLYEALAHGTPVIARDLPAYASLKGQQNIYLGDADLYWWKKVVEQIAQNDRKIRNQTGLEAPEFPTWETHVNLVLERLADTILSRGKS
ncbi:MAG: glycosyltransferase [Pseudomonadota bacterium]